VYATLGCDPDPVRSRSPPYDERAAALMAMKQPFLAQDIDGLAHRDARHFELALELDQRGDFLAGLPLPSFDALTHDRRDLDIEGDAAAVVCLQELGHGRCQQVVWR